jgi:hypothetical protein
VLTAAICEVLPSAEREPICFLFDPLGLDVSFVPRVLSTVVFLVMSEASTNVSGVILGKAFKKKRMVEEYAALLC